MLNSGKSMPFIVTAPTPGPAPRAGKKCEEGNLGAKRPNSPLRFCSPSRGKGPGDGQEDLIRGRHSLQPDLPDHLGHALRFMLAVKGQVFAQRAIEALKLVIDFTERFVLPSHSQHPFYNKIIRKEKDR
jgi:hypothetical protein